MRRPGFALACALACVALPASARADGRPADGFRLLGVEGHMTLRYSPGPKQDVCANPPCRTPRITVTIDDHARKRRGLGRAIPQAPTYSSRQLLYHPSGRTRMSGIDRDSGRCQEDHPFAEEQEELDVTARDGRLRVRIVDLAEETSIRCETPILARLMDRGVLPTGSISLRRARQGQFTVRIRATDRVVRLPLWLGNGIVPVMVTMHYRFTFRPIRGCRVYSGGHGYCPGE